jgi:hypothetical protein
MEIKKFYPKSPDPYLGKNKADAKPAQFGHLNYLVSSINKEIDTKVSTLATVIQKLTQKSAFLSTWDTTITGGTGGTEASAANQVRLPLVKDGTYYFFVEWGDGTSNWITSYNQPEVLHTYTTGGTYQISIKGLIKGFSFQYNDDAFAGGGDHNKLISINQWGTLIVNSPSVNWAYFQGCYSLTTVNAADTPDLSEAFSLGAMFETCPNLATITNFNSWDVSKITNFAYMFENQWQHNTLLNPDCSSWNVSNGTDFTGMFYALNAFNRNLSSWNMSKATSIGYMFGFCYAFNNGGDPGIGNWNTSNITFMDSVFGRCSVFNQPIGTWDMRKVTSIRSMFREAYAFNQPLGNWQLLSLVNAPDTFLNTSYAQNISTWNLPSSVNNMWRMNVRSSMATWDIRNVFNLSGAIGSGMSIADYSATLIAWAALPYVQRNIYLSSGPQYSASAAAARQFLITNYNWTIADGGLQP